MIALRTTGRDLSRDLARSIAVIVEGRQDPMLWSDDELREAHEDLGILLGREVRFWTVGDDR